MQSTKHEHSELSNELLVIDEPFILEAAVATAHQVPAATEISEQRIGLRLNDSQGPLAAARARFAGRQGKLRFKFSNACRKGVDAFGHLLDPTPCLPTSECFENV